MTSSSGRDVEELSTELLCCDEQSLPAELLDHFILNIEELRDWCGGNLGVEKILLFFVAEEKKTLLAKSQSTPSSLQKQYLFHQEWVSILERLRADGSSLLDDDLLSLGPLYVRFHERVAPLLPLYNPSELPTTVPSTTVSSIRAEHVLKAVLESSSSVSNDYSSDGTSSLLTSTKNAILADLEHHSTTSKQAMALHTDKSLDIFDEGSHTGQASHSHVQGHQKEAPRTEQDMNVDMFLGVGTAPSPPPELIETTPSELEQPPKATSADLLSLFDDDEFRGHPTSTTSTASSTTSCITASDGASTSCTKTPEEEPTTTTKNQARASTSCTKTPEGEPTTTTKNQAPSTDTSTSILAAGHQPATSSVPGSYAEWRAHSDRVAQEKNEPTSPEKAQTFWSSTFGTGSSTFASGLATGFTTGFSKVATAANKGVSAIAQQVGSGNAVNSTDVQVEASNELATATTPTAQIGATKVNEQSQSPSGGKRKLSRMQLLPIEVDVALAQRLPMLAPHLRSERESSRPVRLGQRFACEYQGQLEVAGTVGTELSTTTKSNSPSATSRKQVEFVIVSLEQGLGSRVESGCLTADTEYYVAGPPMPSSSPLLLRQSYSPGRAATSPSSSSTPIGVETVYENVGGFIAGFVSTFTTEGTSQGVDQKADAEEATKNADVIVVTDTTRAAAGTDLLSGAQEGTTTTQKKTGPMSEAPSVSPHKATGAACSSSLQTSTLDSTATTSDENPTAASTSGEVITVRSEPLLEFSPTSRIVPVSVDDLLKEDDKKAAPESFYTKLAKMPLFGLKNKNYNSSYQEDITNSAPMSSEGPSVGGEKKTAKTLMSSSEQQTKKGSNLLSAFSWRGPTKESTHRYIRGPYKAPTAEEDATFLKAALLMCSSAVK
ncbi:unnamed protein product [Amoebophrya sp. A25]|nr:unnamed protein product [Amoebophrya sp. A25]|eukprot:GSA25T00017179001.1